MFQENKKQNSIFLNVVSTARNDN